MRTDTRYGPIRNAVARDDSQSWQRFATVLHADVAGFSRLMALDEVATVARLDAARRIFRTEIDTRAGRVVDMAGDSVLAAFTRATSGLFAALAIQCQLESALQAGARHPAMRFRIGVHAGDIIEKADGTIYGNAVNVAARLQALAEPGGIAVSAALIGLADDSCQVLFADQGEDILKNISSTVHWYRTGPGTLERLKLRQPAINTAMSTNGYNNEAHMRDGCAGCFDNSGAN